MSFEVNAWLERKTPSIRLLDRGNTAAPSRKPDRETPATRSVTAAELFAGAREVRIAHAGEEYRLNITRSGKLILTK